MCISPELCASPNISEQEPTILPNTPPLITAVRYAVFCRCEQLHVYADSELVVKQIQGEYQVKNEDIRPLYEHAQRWIALIPSFSISHVRREFNKEADKLANLAMDTRRNSVKWE